jgi:hypothetical protein
MGIIVTQWFFELFESHSHFWEKRQRVLINQAGSIGGE